MSETIETETVTQTNGVEDKTPKSDTLKGEDEKKSSVVFNAMLSSHMEVEEGNVEPKGSSKVSSSASKIKLLVAGIVFVILIIIIIVLMLPKTPKQNASQLWRFTNESKLESLDSSTWEFEDKIWTIPSDDKEGYVEVKDSNPGKVLAINWEDVVLDDKAVNLRSSQLWIKGQNNSDGSFWLKHKGTGKYLTLFIHKVKGETTTLISVKDFIVGHDESKLEVGHAGAGLNAGGVMDAISSDGVNGCTGKVVITPPFKRGDIEKIEKDGFKEVFQIWANKDKDKLRSTKITVHGTCCWEIFHRLGASQKDIKPGQTDITPSVAYIRTLKTKKCSS